jgi:CheY-specific phosphatase CheX
MALALRNIVRFVSSYVRIDEATQATQYSAKYIACQKTTGAYEGLLGFGSDDDEAILAIADGYAGEYFETADEDALDSVCEFTNCINGLYATELSYNEISIDMLPPEFMFDQSITDSDGFYILPVYITGKKTDLIIKM